MDSVHIIVLSFLNVIRIPLLGVCLRNAISCGGKSSEVLSLAVGKFCLAYYHETMVTTGNKELGF